MKVQLYERIREGCRYVDIYGQVWQARYNKATHEVQLWRADTGFGLWSHGEGITKRVN